MLAICWKLQVLLVFSLSQPPWDGQMATRFLVSAEAAGLPVLVVLNKADLVPEETRQHVVAEVSAVHHAWCITPTKILQRQSTLVLVVHHVVAELSGQCLISIDASYDLLKTAERYLSRLHRRLLGAKRVLKRVFAEGGLIDSRTNHSARV